MKGKPAPKRWRRLLVGPAIVAVVLGLTWLGLREMAYTGRLPSAVKERMPAHWRIPWGLQPDLRDAVEGLYSPDGGQRALAAHRVGNFGPEAAPAIPFLMALLADEKPYEIFGKTPPPPPTLSQRVWKWLESFAPPPKPQSYEEWWRLKQSGDMAADALADIGPAAVEPLLAALKNPLPRVRGRAAAALGFIGDRRATVPLAALADTDEYVLVRQAALRALGMSGDPQAVPLMIAWLQKHPHDSYYAAGALARAGDERAIAPLRDLLHDSSFLDNPCYVELALLNLGPRGLDALLELEGRQREEMPFSLFWQLRYADSLPDDPRFFDLMADALIRLEPRDTRTQILFLVKLDPKRAVEPLLEFLKKKGLDDDAMSAAIYALGETGDERALAPLLAVLPETKGYVRVNCVQVLGKLHAEAAREAILNFLRSPPDRDTDYWAWGAIRDWHDPRILPIAAARHGKELTYHVCAALAALGPAGVDTLLEKLADPDPAARSGAAWALGEIGDPRAFEPLLARYSADLTPEERNALARIRDPRVVKLLMDDFAGAAPQARLGLIFDLASTKDPAALGTVYQWWQGEADKAAGHPYDPYKESLVAGTPASTQVSQETYTVYDLLLGAGDVRGLGPWVAYARDKPPRFQPRMSMGIDVAHPIDAWGGDFKRLAALGAAAALPLVRALAVDNPEVQADAAAALLVIGDERGLGAVWAAWPALPFEVRRSVAAQLGRKDQLDTERAWVALTQILSHDRDRIVRKEVYRQLSARADPAHRAAYLDLAGRESCPTVREFARWTTARSESELYRSSQVPLAGDWPADDGDKVLR